MEANLQNLQAAHAGPACLRHFAVPAGAAYRPGNGGDIRTAIKPFGLAEAEFRVLTTLSRNPTASRIPSDLCARASQSPANMSRISDALVEPRPHHARVERSRSAPHGAAHHRARAKNSFSNLLPKLLTPLREMLKDFPEPEQRQLAQQLKRLGAQVGSSSAPCGHLRQRHSMKRRLALASQRLPPCHAGLRRIAAEAQAGQVAGAAPLDGSQTDGGRRLAGARMVEALSGSHFGSIDRAGRRQLAEPGHCARPL